MCRVTLELVVILALQDHKGLPGSLVYLVSLDLAGVLGQAVIQVLVEFLDLVDTAACLVTLDRQGSPVHSALPVIQGHLVSLVLAECQDILATQECQDSAA